MAAPGLTEGGNRKTWGGVDTNMPTTLAENQPPPLSQRLQARAQRKAEQSVQKRQGGFEVLAVLTHAFFDAITAGQGGQTDIKPLDDNARDSRKEANVIAEKIKSLIMDKDLDEAIRILRDLQIEPLLQEAFAVTNLNSTLKEADINAQRILEAFRGLTGADLMDLALGKTDPKAFEPRLQKLKDLLLEEIADNIQDALTGVMELLAVLTHSLYDAIQAADKGEQLPMTQSGATSVPTPAIGESHPDRDSQREAREVCEKIQAIIKTQDFEELIKILRTLPIGPLFEDYGTNTEMAKFFQKHGVDVHKIASVSRGITAGDLIEAAMGREPQEDLRQRWQQLKDVLVEQIDIASQGAQEILAVVTHVLYDSIIASSSSGELRDLKYDGTTQQKPWEQRNPREEAKIVAATIEQLLKTRDFQKALTLIGAMQVSPLLHVLINNTGLGEAFDKNGIDRRAAVQDTKGSVLADYVAAIMYPSRDTPGDLPEGAQKMKGHVADKVDNVKERVQNVVVEWLGQAQRTAQPFFEALAYITKGIYDAMHRAGLVTSQISNDPRTQARTVTEKLQDVITTQDWATLQKIVRGIELSPVFEDLAPLTKPAQMLQKHQIDIPRVARTLRGLTVGDLIDSFQGKRSLELEVKRFHQTLLAEMDTADQPTQEIKEALLLVEGALLTGVNFVDVFTDHVTDKDADAVASLLALYDAIRTRKLREQKENPKDKELASLHAIDMQLELQKLQNDPFLAEGARRALGRSASLTKEKVQADVFVALGTLEWSVGTLLTTLPKLIPPQSAEGEAKGIKFSISGIKLQGIDFPIEGVKMTLLGSSMPPRGALVDTPYGKARMIGYKMSDHCFIVELLDWPKRKNGTNCQAYMQPNHVRLLEAGTTPHHVDQETLAHAGTGTAAKAAEKLGTAGDKKLNKAPSFNAQTATDALDFLSFAVGGGGGVIKNVKWSFEQTGFPHLKDSGTVDVWVSGVALAVSMNPGGVPVPSASPSHKTKGGHKLKEEAEAEKARHTAGESDWDPDEKITPVDGVDVLALQPVRLEVSEINCSIDSVKAEIDNSKRDNFYNFLGGTFENLIKKQIKSNVESILQEKLEMALDMLNDKIANQFNSILRATKDIRPRFIAIVEEAQELSGGKGPFGKRNLYLKFRINYRGKPIASTTTGVVRKGGENPVWTDKSNIVTFTLPATIALSELQLDVEIWDTHKGDLGLKRDSRVGRVIAKDLSEIATLVQHQSGVSREEAWWWRVDTGGRIKVICNIEPPQAVGVKGLAPTKSAAEVASAFGAAQVLEAAAIAKVA